MKYCNNTLKNLISIILSLSLVIASLPAEMLGRSFLAPPGSKGILSGVLTAKLVVKDKTFEERETSYRKTKEGIQEMVERIGQADIVIGIPFINEKNTLLRVVQTVAEGLNTYFSDKRAVIVCGGEKKSNETLHELERISFDTSQRIHTIAFLKESNVIKGKGWSIRAMMEIAQTLGAHCAFLDSDLITENKESGKPGLNPEWIKLLLEPIIKEKVDVVLSRYISHPYESAISRHLISPLFTSINRVEVPWPISKEIAIAHKNLGVFLKDPYVWHTDVGNYGINSYLISQAIVNDKMEVSIAELGVRRHEHSPGKFDVRVRAVTKSVFDEIARNSSWWQERGYFIKSFLPAESSLQERMLSDHAYMLEEPRVLYREKIRKYKEGFDQFNLLYKIILPGDIYKKLENLREQKPKRFELSSHEWTQIVYRFLLAYCFSEKLEEHHITKGDILNAFIPVFHARVATFVKEIEDLKKSLGKIKDSAKLVCERAEKLLQEEINEFINLRYSFIREWQREGENLKSYLPRIGKWEFIPGIGLLVPKEFKDPSGKKIGTSKIYDILAARYDKKFENIVYERLGVKKDATSLEIAQAVREFIQTVEKELDEFLLPGDIHKLDDVRTIVHTIFDYFSQKTCFVLKKEKSLQFLKENQPPNLTTMFRQRSLTALFEETGYDPGDILALAHWSEEREYVDALYDWIRDNTTPDDFELSTLKPLVVSHKDYPALAEMKEVSGLERLTGRIVISDLPKAKGGEFPKLRYFTTVAKNIVESERWSEIWQEFARNESDFANKVVNSLEGHIGTRPFSAHNMFENKNQRILVKRIRKMAKKIKRRIENNNNPALALFVSHLRLAADSYHLAMTMTDGKFIPFSIWTWASYSFKGGRGFPTPYFLHVERDGASRDFLLACMKAAKLGDEEVLDKKIIKLIGKGKEKEDLAYVILGLEEDAEKILEKQMRRFSEEPEAGMFIRETKIPLLRPIKEHDWESKFVLNPGSPRFQLEENKYLVYRAFGKDRISRLGLAVLSPDGRRVIERLPEPIFEPVKNYEGVNSKSKRKIVAGCEDPRITIIDDTLYMLYTAFNGHIAQLALASISKKDFLDRNWKAWKRHGLPFPGVENKDAVLFPEKINGKFVVYHRIDPDIWIVYLDSLECPWPKEGNKIVIGPRSGMMWDSKKIGAGPAPVKTKYGWLSIYHGLQRGKKIYRAGLLLTALNNPAEELYRSPNPVLEPETEHERGEDKGAWEPWVVFPSAVIPLSDEEMLGKDDEILVYYGASDTVICFAKAKIGELIPEEVRTRILESDAETLQNLTRIMGPLGFDGKGKKAGRTIKQSQ